MKLVEARVGLTNYYQAQVTRNPLMDIDSTIIDSLTSENHNGGITPAALKHAAVMSGGLNAQPSGWATIAGDMTGGGWNESKGLMMMTFLVQDSPVMVEYMHVIGYVTNNESMEGLTVSAMFHPSMSWKTQETITSGISLNNPTNVRRQLGGRTDYLYNDGSNQTGSMITLRPNDIIDYTIERANSDDLMNRMMEEGADGMIPSVTVGGSDINRVGVIPSKRANINPSQHAHDMLKAGTSYQRNQMIGGGQMDVGVTENQFDGMYGELSNISYQASNSEPLLPRDNFFREMMDVMGSIQMKGFTGYTIGDLLMVFDNFNDVLDLTFMDRNEFILTDFTQNTESFGTAQLGEFVSHEIEMNILDLMMKYNLSGISLRGSNCDNFGDGGLDNIVILPFSPASLEEDDFQLGAKVEGFVSELTSQIFAKLNGVRADQMVPIRFDVTAELFGTCTINTQIVNQDNVTNGFNTTDSGETDGMTSRVFPTFAINASSPVLADSNTAQEAGSNFFNNIQAYFG